jgi:hypothetical protein
MVTERIMPLIFAALIATILLIAPSTAGATSVNQFEALTKEQKTRLLQHDIEDLIANIRDRQRANQMKNYFRVIPQGWRYSEGIGDFMVELLAYEERAEQNSQIDLNSVSVERILLKVANEKFPPL